MNQTKSTSKKLLALLLALIMTVSLLPVSVFAEELATGESVQEEVIDLTGGEEDSEDGQQDASQPADGEDSQEPEEEPVQESADTYAATDENAVEAATTINYVEKKQSVPLPSAGDMGYRIVHIDCGRKYFTFEDLKKIIGYAADNNYTHVELAFGNDGLRFLLDDMKLTVDGTTYTSEAVTSAIKEGNVAFGSAGELTESEMGKLISYAKSSGIGIIPMFDAPGHLQVVVSAMKTLGLNPKYTTPTTSGTSVNYAIDPTDAATVNFVQALMQKYITYFADMGCTMFNIAADECGFYITDNGVVKQQMNQAQYTAYAKLVNSMAAMVQNAGMTALAFNDGIYHKKCTLDDGVSFDTNIAICYWDASTDKYASAATLAGKDFKIINTHNKWYYVIGASDTDWYGATWSANNMNGKGKADCIADKCNVTDGGYTTDVGCMNAIWCDTPSNSVDMGKIETHISTLAKADNNVSYFKAPETPKEPEVTVDKPTVVVGETVTFTLENYTETQNITWKSSDTDVLKLNTVTRENNSITAEALKEGNATVTATVEGGASYSASVTVTEQQLEQRTITVTVGGTATDTIEGEDYSGEFTPAPDGIATVSAKSQTSTTSELVKITSEADLDSGAEYVIYIGSGSSKRQLTNTVSTDLNIGAGAGTMSTGIELNSGTPSTAAGTWKITKAEEGYYVQTSDGKYLTISNASASTQDSQKTATLAYNAADYWTISQGNAYLNQYGGQNRYAGGWDGRSTSAGTANPSTAATDSGSQWHIQKVVPAGTNTTVTFKGVKEGTAYVTIGNVRYTIEVSKEDLREVDDLYIQLWSTNVTIQNADAKGDPDTTNVTTTTWDNVNNQDPIPAKFVKIKAEQAYDAAGVPLSELVPQIMKRYENGGTYWIAEQKNKDQATLVLLKGKTLDKGNYQTVWGKDRSDDASKGTTFQYVRYWDGNWQVSPDGKSDSWTPVSNWVTTQGYTDASSSSLTQIIAYYKIRTQVIDEVATDLGEWATLPHTKEGDNYSTGFCLLDFRVKDDTGLVEPKSFPVTNKTMGFACGSGVQNSALDKDGKVYYRRLNDITATAADGYEIYMITLTPTSDDPTEKVATTASEADSYSYDGTEKVVWVKSEADLPANFKSEDTHYLTSPSGEATTYFAEGEPNLESVDVYYQQGLLVTYYVRQIKTEDSLTVHYRLDGKSADLNATTEDFYGYNINVTKGTFFEWNIQLDTPAEGPLNYGTVTNQMGRTEQVTADLNAMPRVPAEYRYADYKCVKLLCFDENGNQVTTPNENTKVKHLILYYTITAEKTFVVDFGLPLTITPADVNNRLNGDGVTINEVKMGSANEAPNTYGDNYKTDYASIETQDDSHNVIYTLNNPLDTEDTFGLQYTGTLRTTEEGKETTQPGSTARYTITIIPAANVYYEDSFVTFTPGTDESGNPVEWSAVGSEKNATQALEVLGEKQNVYGYDPAYNECTTFSMDSAKKVTVNASVTTNPTAQFTFKGTGFDVISLTDNQSGAIMVKVYKETDTAQKPVKSHFVNNYYGYTYTEGTGWEVDKTIEGSNALYQIPVMKVTGLDYGEYTVVITAAYSSIFDTADAGQYSFWLDAIRVYDPMGPDADGKYYQQDGEGWAQYIRLRNELAGKTADIGADDEGNKVLFIDGKEDAGLEDYTNYGPNNEVYLMNGQAISFKLDIPSNVEIDSVQIGAKAPMGTDMSAVMRVNEQQVGPKNGDGTGNIASATEMYYDITEIVTKASGQVTITNLGVTGILSLTNLKITFKSEPQEKDKVTLAKLTDEEKENAVQAVRALFAAPVEPDPEPFTPERFETSWSRDTVKVGQKATLTVKTSEDVEAITVNGETVTAYRTRTQRTGWGWNAKRVTYREFTYTITANEAGTLNYSVAAVNAEGVASEPVVHTLTVQAAAQRPGWGGWLGNLFGRWF